MILLNQRSREGAVDKSAVRQRLEQMRPVANVYPTARSHARVRTELQYVADAVDRGAMDEVEHLSFDDARNVLSDELIVRGSALPQLSDIPDVKEQLAGFARAGLPNFFEADPSYASSSLDARRARGGNGAVTRVLVADGRVALETRRLVVGFEQTTTESAVRDIFETLHLVPIRRIPSVT